MAKLEFWGHEKFFVAGHYRKMNIQIPILMEKWAKNSFISMILYNLTQNLLKTFGFCFQNGIIHFCTASNSKVMKNSEKHYKI